AFMPVLASGGREPPVETQSELLGETTGGSRPPLASTIVLASLVTCDHPECGTLPVQLLGRVLLADTLADARWLAALHPGCRVITRAGELLEPDDTRAVGPPQAEAGLVPRTSALRVLRAQHRAASGRIATADVELVELRRQTYP